ncbi:MAG: DmsC/YnfH family molybdoenzyme membrane anchor subunit [Pseudomonadota bacterium]
MHPPFSIIFFTVITGMGYGALTWLGLLPLTATTVSGQTLIISLCICLITVTSGLLSSILHLANKKNAWLALSQIKTSWLSREGLVALILFPVAISYGAASSYLANAGTVTALGLLLAANAIAVIFCTSMIYASLKTVPQWHTKLTPSSYLLLGFSSGALFLNAVLVSTRDETLPVALFLGCGVAAITVKALHWRALGKPGPVTVKSALGISHASMLLLDTGHGSKNFIEKEFCYDVGPRTQRQARVIVIVLLVGALLLGSLAVMRDSWIVACSACVTSLLGIFLERWLFFVEAKHVVRKYYE